MAVTQASGDRQAGVPCLQLHVEQDWWVLVETRPAPQSVDQPKPHLYHSPTPQAKSSPGCSGPRPDPLPRKLVTPGGAAPAPWTAAALTVASPAGPQHSELPPPPRPEMPVPTQVFPTGSQGSRSTVNRTVAGAGRMELGADPGHHQALLRASLSLWDSLFLCVIRSRTGPGGAGS